MAQLELIPYSVVDSLIHKLTWLTSTDFGRVHGWIEKLDRLLYDIEIIKATLSDDFFDEKLKDVLHTADDFFDEVVTEIFILESQDGGKVRGLFSCINGIYFQFQIALQIEKLEKMFDDTLEMKMIMKMKMKMKMGLDFDVPLFETRERESTSSFQSYYMIGREDEKRRIINLLLQPGDGSENVSLVGVVGIGGIGKTVVARMVYNDRDVTRCFEICIWVYVSDNFDVKNVLKNILESLDWEPVNHQESLESLQNKLQSLLNGKKYLLVLDDVLNESHQRWIQLKTYLMCGAPGSKILVTTRSEKVAGVMEVGTLVHLKGLSEEDSWSLFKKLVFEDDNHPMVIALEQVGKKIVKQCRGVPMAIRTVSSELYGKDKQSEWIYALETDFSKMNVEDGIMSDRMILAQTKETEQRETSSMLGSDMIGREDEKRRIINLLLQPGDGSENVSLVGVVGIGGIGKTAVAQMVYNDRDVTRCFEICIWVHVSDNFDVKSIAKKIFDSSSGRNSNHQVSLESLQNKIRNQLYWKKYLLVLDDIWNESYEKWTQLKTYLMCGAPGSKILVTTRSTKVAKVMEVSSLFPLKSLSEEDSWSLLKKLAFRNDNNLMIHPLEQVGKKIVKKCRGVPLAIRTVADMLFSKDTESEWINVLEGGFWKPGERTDGNNIMSSLALSYQHLSPHQLKQCLAYCSIYPMGQEIETNELIQLWMAQGYLECLNVEKEMEDIGTEFVNTLREMSFIQDPKTEYDNIVSFKMHDLMHDLVVAVASNDYYLNSEKKVETPIHMCFSLESNSIDLLGSINARRLRTFFLQQTNDRGTAQMTRQLSVILRFKRLRALNLSRSSLKMFPDLIGKLKHLRYLDLSWCAKLARLPNTIGNLVNLQTLKLTGCETLEFSTEVITKLINLRHLEIHRCKAFEEMMPVGLGKLSSLQSLSSFYVVDDPKKKSGKLNELQNLNSLRGNLEINRLDQVKDVMLESQDVNLKGKKLLVSLELNWENQDETKDSLHLLENLRPHQDLRRLEVRWYPGDKFSNWLSEINHLSYISLFGFDNCKYLPPLENLPYLKSLEISSMKVLEYINFEVVSSTEATFFQTLERLKFSGCKNFKGWKGIEGDASLDPPSLPQLGRLSELIINKCPKLIDLPTFPNVEEMQLCESMMKPLKETLDMASSSSCSTPLSMLKSLKIEGKLPDISILPSQWKQNLTSLECLEIGDVDKPDIWFEGNFPSLQKVVVYGCDLEALPSKMCDLLSLQHIKMMGCHKLASLPKEMAQLTKLVMLEIWDCPLLVERCQKETGVDWPQVKHILNIILRR